MTLEGLIIFLLVGGVAGWLAGLIVRGGGFGIIGNIAVGIVGAFIAGFLFPAVGVSLAGGIVGSIVHATIGAVVLLLIVRVLKRA
ncbi:GlsB/YeaQ/YmgE family stress response membrane protein [uncultured Hyphomonas sp.]|uniref:GlsB/YeaQ/YmgE family stress response membrane protein n=1 Tax=uncultured Hyphomonas sp. TaxID=225298 RepID=UPI002AABC79E|nr:GlsB/YeaQ/YmgE family stress response membrane protein [uncultured Hyphomonas sp.]